MIDDISKNLFKIELPLPDNPLMSVNCYLIKGYDRSLLIDTGMNCKECIEEMLKDLRRINISLDRTDLFITHLHSDHIGLASKLRTKTSKVYFNREEHVFLHSWDFKKQAFPISIANGLDKADLDGFMDMYPKDRYNPAKDIAFNLLSENDEINVGDYSLRCIETPGHSPGHICLYEKNKKLLFSGDHLLGDITPNISAMGYLKGRDALELYLNSLDKIYSLDVALVLPGHRSLLIDLRKRVEALKKHHKTRLGEITSIIGNQKGLNAFEIASRATWDINGLWDGFSPAQKWFATSETLAHLIYLENKGITERQTCGRTIRYFLH